MKRSEMLKLIRNSLLGKPIDLNFEEQILKVVEDAGMLPPPNIGTYDSVPTVTPTGNYDYSWKREWTEE